jgi:hypothetical protein
LLGYGKNPVFFLLLLVCSERKDYGMDKQKRWKMNIGGGKEINECKNRNEGTVSTWRRRNGGEEWR